MKYGSVCRCTEGKLEESTRWLTVVHGAPSAGPAKRNTDDDDDGDVANGESARGYTYLCTLHWMFAVWLSVWSRVCLARRKAAGEETRLQRAGKLGGANAKTSPRVTVGGSDLENIRC